ncbi:DUF4374 domain-containing protein [Flavivirga jejuensis]|uniref:DUF4374 domain-containing protein n=1 Tax=Flavivirga jejuensis TaxID=870487 RepID=A0ABT8WLH7_9FLAO|nr:DUF4374 domain-containing protein [Flavivirga jejuensis]MDO5974016.1 DUF4374 domain-containing protein [Flavivirga jejuensis]
MRTNFLLLTTLIGIIFLSSCSSDDNPTTPPIINEGASKLVMQLYLNQSSPSQSYIISLDNIEDLMTGEISADQQGIEEPEGYRFGVPVGNKALFSFGYASSTLNAISYINNEGIIDTDDKPFLYDRVFQRFTVSEDGSTLLAMEVPAGAGYEQRQISFVDTEDVRVTKKVKTDVYKSEEEGLVALPTGLLIRGDKLFVPYQVHDVGGQWQTLRPNSALMAVYSYPDVEENPIKIIEDDRTCNIGVNASTSTLIKTEEDDIYSLSCGAVGAGFNTEAVTKPSGILRIKNGETDFDESYFFNIEEKTGGKIFGLSYLGNNMAIASIINNPEVGEAWSAYNTIYNQSLVIIDLVAQTVSNIDGIPLFKSGYFPTGVFVEEGKAYPTIVAENEVAIYQIDIATGKATKGAIVKGKDLSGLTRLDLEQ